MSEVISFRLDRHNPREQRAMDVLNAWQTKGYSLRFIITEALIKLDEDRCPALDTTAGFDYHEVVAKVTEMIKCIAKDPLTPIDDRGKGTSQTALTETFLASVMKATRPGLQIE